MMNMFWSFFVTSLAKPGVPEFVLRVYNAKFYSLPWQSFLPTLHNLELMVQVCWMSLEFIYHGAPLSELVQPNQSDRKWDTSVLLKLELFVAPALKE